MTSFGQWLRETRGEKQQWRAALDAGVSEPSWRNWERGTHRPSARKIPGIAKSLGVTVADVWAAWMADAVSSSDRTTAGYLTRSAAA